MPAPVTIPQISASRVVPVTDDYLELGSAVDGSAKVLAKNVAFVAQTYAALRAAAVTHVADGTTVYVAGRGAPNDGGEGNFVYRSASTAVDNGGTILEPTIGAGAWIRAAAMAVVRPEWFGTNTTPGTTDMSAAFAAAAAALVDAGLCKMELKAAAYYLGSVVTFNTANQLWRITGESGAGWLGNQKGTIITGPATGSMEAFFKFAATLQSVEIDHIAFVGGSTSVGVVSAIKNTGEGGPGRPFNIHHCQFYQHARAISSVLAGGGTNTGACQMNIRENTFFGCTYALYGAGDIGALMDVNFEGNVSEQGGRILTLNNGAGGSWRIVSNIFEGQSDAVVISAGLCSLIFESNYFESNTGYSLKFSASNGSSFCRVAGNFWSGSTQRFYFSNCQVVNEDYLSPVGYVESFLCNRNSRFRQSKFYLSNAGSDTSLINQLDTADVLGSGYDKAALGGVLKIVGSRREPTPLGMRTVENFTQNSSTFSVAGSPASGDWVIVTALVRQRNATAQTIAIVVYDNTISYLGETSAISCFPAGGPDGGWVLIHGAVKISGASTGNYRVRFATQAAGQASVADFYSYTKTVGDTTTPLCAFLPTPGAGGVATVLNTGTSVVVAHGLGYAPQNVNVTPQANLGAVWVDTIDATNFTIHCGTAASGDQTVAWNAW